MSMPCNIRSRASTPSRISLAAMIVSFSARDDAHNVDFLHDDQLVAVELDLGTRPFAKQHPVAGLDVEGLDLAILASCSRSDGKNFPFHRFFRGGIRDDDPPGGFGLGIDTPDQDPVVQWTQA